MISRSRRRARDAATFSELFAEVLHPPEAGTGQPERGADLHAALTVSFEESIRGGERQVVVTRQDAVGLPRRRARPDAGRAVSALPGDRQGAVGARAHGVCEGVRRVRRHRRQRRRAATLRRRTAASCAARRCRARSRRVADGARLRVPEKGHAGGSGGRTGDLYVDVQVQPHPVFRREGDDLFIVVPVAVHEAVLGARIDVPTLDGASGCGFRRARRRASASGFSGRGAPTRRRAAAISSWSRGSCCRRSSTSDRRN